jgi:quinol monooxygenase YgiN
MLVVSGMLEFKPEDRDFVLGGLVAITAKSRKDEGCVEYWWAEEVDVPNRFRFFEAWETEELFEAHRDQPHEHDFMERYVSRITAADAHIYDVSARRSAIG